MTDSRPEPTALTATPPGWATPLHRRLARPRIWRVLRWVGGAGVATMVALSTPALSYRFINTLQEDPALTPAELARFHADAILVLSAGRSWSAREYGLQPAAGGMPDALYLERLHYGAFLAGRTGLPLLVSGGLGDGGAVPSLAAIGRTTLERDFHLSDVRVEERSRTTAENARESAAIARAAGWRRVFLVTHAWHMPRAKAAFRAAGLEVVPAPTAFVHGGGLEADALLPSPRALTRSAYALHEWIGRFWYALRDGHPL
ncbi:YdcF family protein [Azospirillum sp. A1-3]|uniref:YdcF family protein n=1 Tax=Azospirillum sp. A1-3 TaxID=185874 RepID=UPI0020773C7F|nr:YdcF family protein [Azospirillum sp. A1-3]MCM8738538.1 YdcF family protein [Azospirillum sp. A1-3]